MELRVLQYFLAVAREQSITAAAESLHLSQPTLSRQLKDLEEELGKPLFVRGPRKITLTEEGLLLRKRADEILTLATKTKQEITLANHDMSGDIYIGAGETSLNRLLASVAAQLNDKYPNIHYHFISDDETDVKENLDKGLVDLGIIFGVIDKEKYNSVKIPQKDIWGVMMRNDCELAKKEVITPEDLWNKPLILSRQAMKNGDLDSWLKKPLNKLNIIGTYNLLFNGSLLVDEGLGYALCLDKVINLNGNSNLTFRPLSPVLKASLNIVWKKYSVMTKVVEEYLNRLLDTLADF